MKKTFVIEDRNDYEEFDSEDVREALALAWRGGDIHVREITYSPEFLGEVIGALSFIRAQGLDTKTHLVVTDILDRYRVREKFQTENND